MVLNLGRPSRESNQMFFSNMGGLSKCGGKNILREFVEEENKRLGYKNEALKPSVSIAPPNGGDHAGMSFYTQSVIMFNEVTLIR